MASHKVNTTLVCGFLGAGKTTFIKGQLQRPGRRTAVLVNELGEIGLDGADIGTAGPLKVVEMPGGCICCSQNESLPGAVANLVREIRPDRLLIEPSGVAEASAVIRGLTREETVSRVRLESVVTLVDALTFLEDSEPGVFGGFFKDQILNADAVLINKTDLVNRETVNLIRKKILSINPAALVTGTRQGILEEAIPAPAPRNVKTALFSRLHMDTVCRPLEHPWSREILDRFVWFAMTGKFGRICRVKGIIPKKTGGNRLLQYARGDFTIEKTTISVGGRITLIGPELDRTALDNFIATGGNSSISPLDRPKGDP